jgi:hypothetical protein
MSTEDESLHQNLIALEGFILRAEKMMDGVRHCLEMVEKCLKDCRDLLNAKT